MIDNFAPKLRSGNVSEAADILDMVGNDATLSQLRWALTNALQEIGMLQREVERLEERVEQIHPTLS